jgi:hypothetical protein
MTCDNVFVLYLSLQTFDIYSIGPPCLTCDNVIVLYLSLQTFDIYSVGPLHRLPLTQEHHIHVLSQITFNPRTPHACIITETTTSIDFIISMLVNTYGICIYNYLCNQRLSPLML